LLGEQLAELDPGEREVKVRRSQALFARDLPFLTLYYPDWYYAHDGSILQKVSATEFLFS